MVNLFGNGDADAGTWDEFHKSLCTETDGEIPSARGIIARALLHLAIWGPQRVSVLKTDIAMVNIYSQTNDWTHLELTS
jgi:hypothetical protein